MPELGTSLFILPNNDQFETKNRQDRIVVLNSIARRIIDEQRGKHREFVFGYKGERLYNMLNSAWQRARKRAGLPDSGCMTFVIIPSSGLFRVIG